MYITPYQRPTSLTLTIFHLSQQSRMPSWHQLCLPCPTVPYCCHNRCPLDSTTHYHTLPHPPTAGLWGARRREEGQEGWEERDGGGIVPGRCAPDLGCSLGLHRERGVVWVDVVCAGGEEGEAFVRLNAGWVCGSRGVASKQSA